MCQVYPRVSQDQMLRLNVGPDIMNKKILKAFPVKRSLDATGLGNTYGDVLSHSGVVLTTDKEPVLVEYMGDSHVYVSFCSDFKESEPVFKQKEYFFVVDKIEENSKKESQKDKLTKRDRAKSVSNINYRYNRHLCVDSNEGNMKSDQKINGQNSHEKINKFPLPCPNNSNQSSDLTENRGLKHLKYHSNALESYHMYRIQYMNRYSNKSKEHDETAMSSRKSGINNRKERRRNSRRSRRQNVLEEKKKPTSQKNELNDQNSSEKEIQNENEISDKFKEHEIDENDIENKADLSIENDSNKNIVPGNVTVLEFANKMCDLMKSKDYNVFNHNCHDARIETMRYFGIMPKDHDQVKVEGNVVTQFFADISRKYDSLPKLYQEEKSD